VRGWFRPKETSQRSAGHPQPQASPADATQLDVLHRMAGTTDLEGVRGDADVHAICDLLSAIETPDGEWVFSSPADLRRYGHLDEQIDQEYKAIHQWFNDNLERPERPSPSIAAQWEGSSNKLVQEHRSFAYCEDA